MVTFSGIPGGSGYAGAPAGGYFQQQFAGGFPSAGAGSFTNPLPPVQYPGLNLSQIPKIEGPGQ